jgi:Lon protease-like protein
MYNEGMPAESVEVLTEIPIFPLGTVLFPGAILPLHIFEDRYKEMMRHAIENQGQFGLSYREDAAVGMETPPPVGSVGCAAKINAVMPLADGRMNVISTGLIRYRILEVKQSAPFVIAIIEPFSDDPEPQADLSRLQTDTSALTSQFLSALQDLNDARGESQVELPEEAEIFSMTVASALPIDNETKQHLLETTSTRLRLTRLRHYLVGSLSTINQRLVKHERAKTNGQGKMRIKHEPS